MNEALEICKVVGVVVTTLKCLPTSDLEFLGLDFTKPELRKPRAKELYFTSLLLPFSRIEQASTIG